jgi:hypothetical protein
MFTDTPFRGLTDEFVKMEDCLMKYVNYSIFFQNQENIDCGVEVHEKG